MGPLWPTGELWLRLRPCAVRTAQWPGPLAAPPCALPSPVLSRSGQRASLVVPSRFPAGQEGSLCLHIPLLLCSLSSGDGLTLTSGCSSSLKTRSPGRRELLLAGARRSPTEGSGSCGHSPSPLAVSRLTRLPPLGPPCSDFGFFQALWEWRLGLPLPPLPEPPALSGSFAPDEVLQRAGTASASTDKQRSKSPSLEVEKSGFPRGEALSVVLGGELWPSFRTVGPHPPSRVPGDE